MTRTLVVLLALATPRLASADIDGNVYNSKEWGVQIVAPRNWQLSERTSYPSVILWMSRRSAPEGKMLVSVERVNSESDTLAYVKKTVELLRDMRFTVRAAQFHAPSGAYWLDFDDGTSFLRQAYSVKNGLCVVLTLSAPSGRIRNQHLRAFDLSLRSLTLTAPGTSGAPPEPSGVAGPGKSANGATGAPPKEGLP